MKYFALFFFINTLGWGASYDPFLLDTHLTLLPKITMLEKGLASQSNVPLKILIAYDRGDEATAQLCTRILIKKFNGSINNHPLIVNVMPFDKLDASNSYHLIYALKASLSQLKKVHNAVGNSGAITALYDANKLGDDGLLLSIQMERTPIILINSKALKENKVSLPDTLLEMARII